MLCTRIINKLNNGKHILPVISSQISSQCNTTLFEHNKPNFLLAAVDASVCQMRPLLQNTQCRFCTTGTTGMVNADGKERAQVPQSQEQGIIKRVLNKVGFTPNSKARLKVTSFLLYESVADKINYLYFFRDFNLPNTFNSWFLVAELHVWMLLVRAMAEGSESGEDGRFLRNGIVEAMWGDVNTRAKKLGAHNPSRTRQQIETLSEQFQAALIAYDEGIMSDDRVLAAALWRRFFEMNCNDYEMIERIVKYVRMQMAMLDKIPREEFLQKPNVPWLELPKVTV